jgi:hypothetical protein
MRAALADLLDQGEFIEGHEMVGRRLSQEEAKRLLAKFDRH